MGEAPLAARLDLATGRGTVLVDRAPDAPPQPAAQREAPAAGVEPQMRVAVGVVHDEPPHQVGLVEERIAGQNLDVVHETLGAIFVGVRAAGPAARAVERFRSSRHLPLTAAVRTSTAVRTSAAVRAAAAVGTTPTLG